MKVDNIFDVAGLIVVLAIVTQVVTSPNTAKQVKAVADGFQGSLRAATGK